MNYSDKTFFAMQDMPTGQSVSVLVVVSNGIYRAGGVTGKTQWLHFLGINYRANVWINGEKIGGCKGCGGDVCDVSV